MQLSILDLIEAAESEPESLCARCGWGNHSPAHCSGARDLASDFDVLFSAEPEPVKPLLMQLAQLKFACPFCKANADVVDAYKDLIDVVCSKERKHYAIIKKSGASWSNKKKDAYGSGESGKSCGLPMYIYCSFNDRDQTAEYADAMKIALDLKIENLLDPDYKTVFLQKENIIKENQLAREIFNRFPIPDYRSAQLGEERRVRQCKNRKQSRLKKSL